MEDAHRFVMTHTARAILRQKEFHDNSLSYETYVMRDKVYVLFPIKKPGRSLIFAWFWKGPFEVKRKLCDFLYEVDCRRAGSLQIIHTERMSKVKSQILRGEEILVPADDILNEEDVEEQQLPNGAQTAEQSD